MTKSILLIFSSILLVVGTSFGQKESYKYTLVEDNPTPKYAGIYAQIFSLDLEKYNFSLKTGLEAKMMFNRVSLDLGWEFDYLDGLAQYAFFDGSNQHGGYSVYGDQNSRNGYVTLGFSIIDKNVKKQIPITVKTVGNTSYYINVDATENQKINLDVGFNAGFTWYALNNLQVTGKNVSTGEIETFTGGDLYTYMNYSLISIGGSFSRYNNVTVKISKGNVENVGVSRIYGAVLISTKAELEDIYKEVGATGNNTPIYNTYEINDYMDYSPVGFKLGYSADFLNKFSAGFTVETGLFPGTGGFSQNAYLSIMSRIGFSQLFN
jgi:hypothetical protein